MLWNQFGAAIDMLDDAVRACPDALWTSAVYDDEDDPRYGQFWYVATHTLVWLDLYLDGTDEGFEPLAPFVRSRLPDTPYTKPDILRYLLHCRRKCQSVLEALTDEQAHRMCAFRHLTMRFLELQLYNMRHVQEHSAQLHLMLGHHGIAVNDWIRQAQDDTP
jgi:hypothetical protein